MPCEVFLQRRSLSKRGWDTSDLGVLGRGGGFWEVMEMGMGVHGVVKGGECSGIWSMGGLRVLPEARGT